MDVTTENFERDVIQRLHELPVVVDVRPPGADRAAPSVPRSRAEVEKRSRQLELAKLSVGAAPVIAGRYGI